MSYEQVHRMSVSYKKMCDMGGVCGIRYDMSKGEINISGVPCIQ